MANMTFGSDPEFMLVNKQGKYVSAIGIVPGTKEDKVPLGNGHYAFYDNVLVECNISPAAGRDNVVSNFRDCFQRLAKLIGPKFRLTPQASQVYPKAECEHKDAKVFGCDPEYCVYERDEDGRIKRMDPPVCDENNTFRSGGGHVHIGHEKAMPMMGGKPVEIVRMMDVIVGCASVLMDHDPTSAARRKLYGGAGTHRVNFEYGLEYRSLSNYWLASPKLVQVVYDLTETVVGLIEMGVEDKVFTLVDGELVRKTINTGNKAEAASVLKRVSDFIPAHLNKKILEMSEPNQYDFYREWNL